MLLVKRTDSHCSSIASNVKKGPILSHFVNPGKKLSNFHLTKSAEDVTSLHELEKQTIMLSLKKAKYVKSHAARLLNISRQSLDRKIEKFNIPVVWR
jgi:transcriptional regulator with PAS, ATPase and Fis domain